MKGYFNLPTVGQRVGTFPYVERLDPFRSRSSTTLVAQSSNSYDDISIMKYYTVVHGRFVFIDSVCQHSCSKTIGIHDYTLVTFTALPS